jgi:hypothetical protein
LAGTVVADGMNENGPQSRPVFLSAHGRYAPG